MELETARKLPLWSWWLIGIAAIAGVAAGIVFLIRETAPSLPPGLVEKRREVAKILDESSQLEDVDLKPLLELETKKDFRGAAELMAKALEVNGDFEILSVSLVKVSNELTKLALAVKPDDIGIKAMEAFDSLARLAQAEKKFYENRRRLYELTQGYYAGLAAKKKPALPEGLRSLALEVNNDLDKAKELHQQFAAAVKAFDDMLQR